MGLIFKPPVDFQIMLYLSWKLLQTDREQAGTPASVLISALFSAVYVVAQE